MLLALQDDTGVGLVPRDFDGFVDHGFVFDDPAGLDTATRGDNHFRLGVVDARC